MLLVFHVIISVSAYPELLPIEISWPSAWVPAQVELSSNQETFLTDLILYVGTSRSIEGLFASVKLPQLSWSVPCNISLWGSDLDFKLICKDLRLNKGTFGPVELTVRASENGLILAKNINIGSFAVVDALKPVNYEGLTIEYFTDDRTVASPCSLTFNFTLTQTMQKFDYLVLTLNPQFSYEPGNLTWNNEFNGSNFFLSTEWTYQETTRQIFIYGNPDDVDLVLNIGFTLTGFFIPGSVKNEFLWVLDVKKFGANTLIQKYVGFGPTSKIIKGVFTKVSWNFIHPNLKLEDTVNGLVTYTLLQFESNHSIPINGTLKVDYSGLSICGYTVSNDGYQLPKQSSGSLKDCGLVFNTTDSQSVLQCEAKNNTSLICQVKSAALSPASIVSIYNLVAFDGDGKISNVSAFDDQGNLIDSLKDPLKIAIGFNDLLSVSYLGFISSESNSTAVNKAGDIGSFGFYVEFFIERELQVGENFTVYFPVKKALGPEEQVACLGEYLYGKFAYDRDGNSFESLPKAYWRNSTRMAVGAGNITVWFEDTIPGESTFMFYLGTTNKEGTVSNMFLPLFPTFQEDLNQVLVKVVTDDLRLIFSTPFFIDFNELDTQFVPFCNNSFYPGLPIQVFVMLGFYLKSYSSQFYVLFEFDKLDSGVQVGSSLPSSPPGAVLHDEKTVKYEFQSFKQDVYQSFVIPFNGMTNGLMNMSASLYVLRSSGKAYKLAYGKYQANYTGIENIALTTLAEIPDQRPQKTLEIKFKINDISLVLYRIAIFGSQGFQLASVDLDNQVQLVYLYDQDLAYPSSFAVDDTSKSKSLGKYSVRINNPWFVNPNDFFVYFAYADGKDFQNAKCTGLVNQQVKITSPLPLVLYNYFPIDRPALTFSDQYFDLFLSFSFEGVIKENSYFRITTGDLELNDVESEIWEIIPEVTYFYVESMIWWSDYTTSRIENWVKLKISNIKLPILHNRQNLTILSSIQIFDSLDRLSYEWTQSNDEAVIHFEAGNTDSFPSRAKNILVYPDVVESALVQFQLSFIVSKDLPSGTSIYIKSDFLEDKLAQDHLFTSFLFTSASLKPPVLTLKTGEDLFSGSSATLTKDFAFNLTDSHRRSVSIWAIKDELFYIFDDYEATSGQFFIPNRQQRPKVTFHKSSVDQLTSGFKSFHYFNFKIDVKVEPGWSFEFDFSRNYQSTVGESVIFEHIPGTRYLPGTWDGERIYCPVSNWLVSCTVGKTVEAEALVSIGLSVLNPGNSGRVSLYVKNSTNDVAVSPFNGFEFSYSSVPDSVILIKSVSHSAEDEKNSLHSLVLEAYFEAQLSPEVFLEIVMPKQYVLKVNNRDQVRCTLTHEANSSFLYDKLCATEENSVKLFFDSQARLLSSSLSVLTISGLVSPVEGFARDSRPYEAATFDIWTNNFQVLLRNKQSVLAMSFGNLNAAYTGFNLTTFKRLLVNDGERVKLVPGVSLCNFSVRAEGKLMSKRIEINATADSPDVFISDNGRFVLSLTEPVSRFCISVSGSAKEGVYYIYWSILETAFVAATYLPPFPTKILVKNDKVFNVFIDSESIIPANRLSQPIGIQIEAHNSLVVSPFDPLEVVLKAETEDLVEFVPNPVVFSIFKPKVWFCIKCLNCTIGLNYVIQGEVSSQRFKSLSKSVFRVTEQPLSQSSSLLLTYFINPSTLSIAVQSDSAGLAYWALIAVDLLNKNTTLVSLESILENSYDFIDNNKSSLSLSSQVSNHRADLDALLTQSLSTGQTYQNFIRLAELYSKETYFRSISKISAGLTNLSTLPNLMPGCKFYIRMFIDNYSDQPVSVLSSYLSSDSDMTPGKLVFQFDKAAPSSDLLIKKLSQVYQQEPYMFSPISTSRRLARNKERSLATTMNIQVFSSVTEGLSGYDLAGSAAVEDLKETFKAFELQDFRVEILDPLDFTKVAWEEVDGNEWQYQDETLHFNFSLGASGKMTCLVEQQPDFGLQLSSEMVLTGTCRDFTQCWDFRYETRVAKGNQMWDFNFTDKGFNESTYAVSCLVCNQFPGEPSCTEIKNVTVEYIRADLSFSIILIMSIGWLLV